MRDKWIKKKIREIGKVQTGSTPKTSDSDNFGDYIPFIKPSDFLKNGSLDYTNQGLSGVGLNQARLVDKNSVLMVCIGATIGKVGFTKKQVTTNQQINSLTPLDGDCAKFLFYQMLTQEFQQKVLNSSGQATLPIINKTKWSNLSLYLPPLPEQKKIVAILDEAFEGIDRAISNTEKNLSNTRELFESYLNSIFSQKGEGWEEKKLHSVVEPSCSLSYGIVQPGNDYESGLPVVRPTDLITKTINLNSLKRIDPLLAESYKRTKLSGGELLLCVRGNTGIVGIAADELKGANVTRGIVPIKFEQSIVIQSFGYYMLISKMTQYQIKEKTYGAALMQINIRDLKNIVLSFPTKEEQQILVEKLDQLEKETQRLETIYRQKIAALKELKQSILQKAFTGELTADKREK